MLSIVRSGKRIIYITALEKVMYTPITTLQSQHSWNHLSQWFYAPKARASLWPFPPIPDGRRYQKCCSNKKLYIRTISSKINVTTKGVYLPLSKLHSFLAVTNLLAHNKIGQICYCGQISLQSAAVNCSFTGTFLGNIHFAVNGTYACLETINLNYTRYCPGWPASNQIFYTILTYNESPFSYTPQALSSYIPM